MLLFSRRTFNVLLGVLFTYPCYPILAHSNVTTEDLLQKHPDLKSESNLNSGVSLNQILKNHLTGLAFDHPGLQAEVQAARWYVQKRIAWKNKPARERILQDCETLTRSSIEQDQARAPFCIVFKDLNQQNSPEPHPRSLISLLRSLHSRIEINSWIHHGDIARLAQVSLDRVRSAFKKISASSDLNRLVSHGLASPTCQSAAITQLLGSKLEEFLPNPETQRTVIQLYEKAITCEKHQEFARARYRLSLIYIWKGQYQAALPHLEALTSSGSGGAAALGPAASDFQSRALFWQLHCEEKLGHSSIVAALKKNLLSKYPFSFHTLLIQKTDPSQSRPLPIDQDTRVQLRSSTRTTLNEKLKATEALLEINETRLAQEILDHLGPDLNKSEPSFRLYVGVLYYRLGLYIRNFQLLNTVFHEDSKLISIASLQLFYPKGPLESFDLSSNSVDEHLLLSLIRQESGFNARAKSAVGARGLMQIMPGTAKRFERLKRYDQLFDPNLNIKIGSKYFNALLNKYGGDAELALAAYNAGPKRVDDWLTQYPVADRILFLDLIPFKETRNYVASIARNYYWYTHLYPIKTMAESKLVDPVIQVLPLNPIAPEKKRVSANLAHPGLKSESNHPPAGLLFKFLASTPADSEGELNFLNTERNKD